MKSLFNYIGQVLNIFYEVIMLCNRTGYSCNIGLLKSIVPDKKCLNLPGNGYHWN